jgi:hypothetical protein
MSLHFRANLTDHAVILYDARGCHIFDWSEAAIVAEELYTCHWKSVFNGEGSVSRKDWLRACEFDNFSDRVNCLIQEAKDDGLSLEDAKFFVYESLGDELESIGGS